MKTYNLITQELHHKIQDKDCFCALGVFLAEKGKTVEQIDTKRYFLLDDKSLSDDLFKMIDFLAKETGMVGDWWTPANFEIVYDANDRRRWTGDYMSLGFAVSADKIKEALALAGIVVELNDFRGKDIKDDD